MNQTPIYTDSQEHRLAEQFYIHYLRREGEWESMGPTEFYEWIGPFDAHPFPHFLNKKDVHRLAYQITTWKLRNGTVIAETWREDSITIYYRKIR